MKEGLIGDISRYCTHDGPGIRTTVFFKGCPLRCPWCHNPELISTKPEIAFYPERCIGCGDCSQACPEEAVLPGKPVNIDRSLCTGCGLCENDCPTKALELVGKKYALEELIEIVLRDHLFYESSGGGVTLSGGEATAQMEFCGFFLRRLKEEKIHTAIETSGFFNWDEFAAQCLDFLDLILFDVKIADPVVHRQIIGVENGTILANLARLIALRPDDVIARVPLVPGYTDSKQNVAAIADLLCQIGAKRYSLLAYHPYGISKAKRVGRKQTTSLPEKPMDKHELDKWHKYFSDMECVEF